MNTVLESTKRYDITPKTLKNGSIFGALSNTSILYLLKKGTLHNIQKGETIFSYGDKGGSFYAVLHGNLDFYKHHENNKREIKTRTIKFGEAIGFVSMIALHEREGSLKANEDCFLLEVSSQLFSDFHDEFPFDFGILLMNLSRDMARTIRQLSDDVVVIKN